MKGKVTVYGSSGVEFYGEATISPEALKGLKTVDDLKGEHGVDWKKAVMHQALRAVGWSDTICINPDERAFAE